MAIAWGEVLQPVRTDWLNECYVRAVRGTEKAVTTGMILRAWSDATASGEIAAKSIALPPAPCDYQCDVGWLTVDNEGRRVGFDYTGATYARACPSCRP